MTRIIAQVILSCETKSTYLQLFFSYRKFNHCFYSNIMIHSKNNSEHYIWGNCCDSWVLNNSQNLSVKQEKMPVGTAEKLDFHTRTEQVFYILKGEAVLYINDEKFSVREGESISIQPKSEHFISNESQDDVEFLVISSPSTQNDRTEIKK